MTRKISIQPNKSNRNSKRKSESGNVFLFILIGIVLFAAIGFVMSRGFRSEGTSKMTEKKLGLVASEIIDFSNVVSRGVDRLRNKGCSESDISFQRDYNGNGVVNDNVADGYNANSPTDKSCHVYDTNGANVKFREIEGLVLLGSGANAIDGLGCSAGSTACREMTLAVKDLDQNLCETINDKLGITTMPTDADGHGGFFLYSGSFTGGAIVGDTDANLSGKTTACYLDNNDNDYIFYHVLIAR